MRDHIVITPYFLDEAYPQFLTLGLRTDAVNSATPGRGDRMAAVAPLHRGLSDLVDDAVRRGERPVSICGDCCSAIGVLAGLQRAGMDVTLLWFDAHGDFNTWETTPSGFLGGMPLAMLVGRGDQRMADAVGLRPLPEGQVILTDARDLDPGEREALEHSAVRVLRDVRLLLEEPPPDGLLWAHFDTDVIDPADAPAQSYPAPGGPSAAVLAGVFARLASTGRVAAVSVSTWNPALDEGGHTRKVCLDLLDVLLGRRTPA
ncbi:MAG: arginase family protein [Armatimonadota bacterium]|nr:arginase family protein [Armatimonadota bacterium]